MSYRDIRNFVEMTRALGYPHLVSLESFRTASFPLVADLLIWLTKRFEPEIDIAPNIATEDERIKLIRTVAQIMAVKANIKLNTRKLYQADGHAVRELLKMASVLYDTLDHDLNEISEPEQDDLDQEDLIATRDFDISDKVEELKLSRQLASEITTSGANLFDLLGKEMENRSVRMKCLTRQYELNDVEQVIQDQIAKVENKINEMKQQIANVATTETALDEKIERRRAEIDRYEKRLQSMKKVRPAFLDEFRSLEEQLERLFEEYATKSLVLQHLEEMVSALERAQYEKQLEITSLKLTMPLGTETDGFQQSIDLMKGDNADLVRHDRPRAGTGGRKSRGKTLNELQIPRSPSPSSLLHSDTETDDLFLDKDEPELMQSSDDESLMVGMEGDGGKRLGDVKGRRSNNSDDEF